MHISWAWPCSQSNLEIWVLLWWVGPTSQSLIQFSVMGGAVFLPVGWPEAAQSWSLQSLWQAMGLSRSDGDLLQEDLGQHSSTPRTAAASAPTPRQAHCGPTPSPELPKRSQASLPQSLAGSWFLSPGFSCACGFVCVLQQSLFPRPMEVLQSNPAELQIPRGFPFPLPDPQVGKSVVGPRTCTAVRALWYSWSPVCGSSTWWLYGRANSAFLQEGFCRTPCCPGLLPSVPLSPWQATAHPASTGDPQTLAVWPRLLRWSPLLSLASFVPSKSMPNRRFDFKCGCTPPAICSWTRGIFFWWVPRSSFRWLSSS